MMGARPDFLLAVNTQGINLFASSACSELAGVSGQASEREAFETLLDIEDRTRFRQFIADSVLPMAGKSFSKFGPLDVRIAAIGKTSTNTIRWAALRVGSIDLLPDSHHQDALFFQPDRYNPSRRGRRQNSPSTQLRLDDRTAKPLQPDLTS